MLNVTVPTDLQKSVTKDYSGKSREKYFDSVPVWKISARCIVDVGKLKKSSEDEENAGTAPDIDGL